MNGNKNKEYKRLKEQEKEVCGDNLSFEVDEFLGINDEGEIDYEDEIIGYTCLGCGHTQNDDDWGGKCEQCDGMSLEPMYS